MAPEPKMAPALAPEPSLPPALAPEPILEPLLAPGCGARAIDGASFGARAIDGARAKELWRHFGAGSVAPEPWMAPEPLTAAAEALDLLPHQVIFVGGSADLMLAAKEARAFTCFVQGDEDVDTKKLRPQHAVEELIDVVFVLESINKEL